MQTNGTSPGTPNFTDLTAPCSQATLHINSWPSVSSSFPGAESALTSEILEIFPPVPLIHLPENFIRGALSLGLPMPSDPTSGDKTGITWVPSSKDPANQTRSYARSAHYDRVISSRPNYHLLPLHSVSKLLVSDNKTLTGVEYVSRETGEIRTALATKEVILAAGTVHTPQVLQLSGIGPKALLDSLDIQTIKDLPGVGYNLQDHPAIYTQWNCKSSSTAKKNIFLQPNQYQQELDE